MPRKASTRSVVLVDMDGTIADASRRVRKYLRGTKKDWPGFFRDMEHDPPIQSVLDRVKQLALKHDIVILTGRPEKYRPNTEEWLKHNRVKYIQLLMRPRDDHRPDYESKAALLDEFLASGRKVVLALDDRGPVCDAYRERGVHVVLVGSNLENQRINELYREIAD